MTDQTQTADEAPEDYDPTEVAAWLLPKLGPVHPALRDQLARVAVTPETLIQSTDRCSDDDLRAVLMALTVARQTLRRLGPNGRDLLDALVRQIDGTRRGRQTAFRDVTDATLADLGRITDSGEEA